jgi:hypothetical protein
LSLGDFLILTDHAHSSLHNFRLTLATRVEFGDALLYLYIVVFVRQYLWILPNNALAWIIAFGLGAICWYVYVATKPAAAQHFGLAFWSLVALPLLVLYGLRAAFPDLSFDVLSYHLLHGERSLRGTLFMPGDFFPTTTPFNPAPDTLTAISRKLLGYRLGTAINWLVLVWAAQIVDKILRPYVRRDWLRAVAVLLVFLAEHLLFELSTYMVDLLALPLMLEATYLTLQQWDRGRPARNEREARTNLLHVAFLLGACTAFKITNLTLAIPLLMLGAVELWRTGKITTQLKTMAGGAVLFLLPLAPFCIYIYRATGNPVFPVANVLFKSPYWPTHGGWDNRWGPVGFWRTLFWPLVLVVQPERYSELSVYSGRLFVGVVAALAGLILIRRNAYVRQLIFLLLSSCLLWSIAALGYSRYGLHNEVIAGLVIVVIVAGLASRSEPWRKVPAIIFVLALLAQSLVGVKYLLQTEWGGRPTVVQDPGEYLKESRLFLRDRSLPTFLSIDERSALGTAPVWVESCVKSTGFEVLLAQQEPIISINHPEYFFTRESRKQFVAAVERLQSPAMASLCFAPELQSAKQTIALRGLEIARVTPIDFPFFSNNRRIGMMLIEIRRPEAAESRAKFAASWMNAAFPDADYRAEITALNAPPVMRAGESRPLRFTVKNLGESTWPAVGNKEGRFQVNIGNRWLKSGSEINGLDGRTGMPADLQPGQQVELQLNIRAPGEPGDYTLEIDMVHEGVTWFYERGAKPLRLSVRVER